MKTTALSTNVIDAFTEKMISYEHQIIGELINSSPMTSSQFTQIVINELSRSTKLQEVFLKNPTSLFASILHCAELGLNPSQMVGEFYFIPFNNTITPILGYKGLITLLYRSNKIKRIWSEVVYEEDDFEYELGLEPKLLHIPNQNAKKTSKDIKCVYACAKIDDEVIFKVMFKEEIQNVANLSTSTNDIYFNDKKDPERWMLKKVVLKQLSKLMPKEDDRLKKAISMDDNVEGGGYLVMDENDSVSFVRGTVIGKKSSIYEKLMQKNGTDNINIPDSSISL